jgi:hypothetical protein
MAKDQPTLLDCVDQASILTDGCRAALDAATGDLRHEGGLTWVIYKIIVDADRLAADLAAVHERAREAAKHGE